MKNTLIIIFAMFALMQLIQVEKVNPNIDKILEIQAPAEVQTILENACYDCHSNKTVWPWYADIAPASWIIQDHVVQGRKTLNFSTWNEYTDEVKKDKLKKIYRTVYAAMPLASYIQLHDEANLTKEQRELIRSWTGVRRW